jgi:hypothetical protein
MSSTRRVKGRSETSSDCSIKVTESLTFTHKIDVDLTLLSTVADEIERGMFRVNDAVALRNGPSNESKPEDLDHSVEGARHRRAEKERRDASHETLGRISLFFKAPPRSLSRNQVLFFGELTTLISNRLVTYHAYSSHHVSRVWRRSVRRRRLRHRIAQAVDNFNR